MKAWFRCYIRPRLYYYGWCGAIAGVAIAALLVVYWSWMLMTYYPQSSLGFIVLGGIALAAELWYRDETD